MGRQLGGLPISIDGNSYQKMPLTRIQSVVMPLVVVKPDTVQIIGTAFTIMKEGVLLTASHVVREALHICDSVDGAWMAVVYVDSGENDEVPDLLGGPIPIRHISMNDSTDIAIVQISLARSGRQYNFPYVGLSTKLPALEEPAFGFGYTRMDVETIDRGVTVLKITASQDFHSTAGIVRDLFPTGRDRVRLPFPCFQLNARFSGGMSGGPIFTASTSRVAGVVCSSFSVGSEGNDLEPISYASMIVAAMALTVHAVLDGREDDYQLLELARRGFIDADEHIQRIGLATNHDGTRILNFWSD